MKTTERMEILKIYGGDGNGEITDVMQIMGILEITGEGRNYGNLLKLGKLRKLWI